MIPKRSIDNTRFNQRHTDSCTHHLIANSLRHAGNRPFCGRIEVSYGGDPSDYRTGDQKVATIFNQFRQGQASCYCSSIDVDHHHLTPLIRLILTTVKG